MHENNIVKSNMEPCMGTELVQDEAQVRVAVAIALNSSFGTDHM